MIQYKCKIMMKKVGNITLYQLPENFLNFLSKFYVYNQNNSKITYEKNLYRQIKNSNICPFRLNFRIDYINIKYI